MLPARGGLLVLLTCGFAAGGVACADAAESARHVGPESPVELAIELDAGDLLHVAARALGVDIALELTAPDGESVWTSDDRPTVEGLEEVWLVAVAPGPHRLRVASRWGDDGEFLVERLERRPANDEDRLRAAAERVYRTVSYRRRVAGADFEALLAELRAASADFVRLGLPERAAEGVAEEAILLRRLGRADEAVARLEGELAAARERGDPLSEARAHNGLSIRAYERGDLRAAIAHAEAAEAGAARAADAFLNARVQNNLGLFRSFAGEYRAAIEHYRRGAAEAARLGWLDGEASAWFNASLAYEGVRDYAAIFDCLRRADALFARLGEPVDQGRLRINEGVLLQDLGEPERARERYQQALAVLPAGESLERARTEHNLGSVALQLGDLAEARQRSASALAAVHDQGQPKLECAILGVLARIDLAQGHLDAARDKARAAVETARTSGVDFYLAASLTTLGEATRRAGDPAAAQATLDQALAVAERLGDPGESASARLARARLRRDQGALRPALDEVEAGIESVERVRRAVPTLELQATLLARYRELFDLAIELRAALERAEPGRGHAAAAFALAEQARARSLLASLPALAWRSDATSRDLRDLGTRLGAAREEAERLARDPGAEPGASAEAVRQLDLALAEYERARATWIADHPREGAALDRRATDLAEVQSALDAGDLLLEYHVGEERAFLFAIARDRFELIPLGDSRDLARDVDAVLPRLVQPSIRGATAYREAALRLARRALPRDGVAGRRLRISPDGPLVGLPFEALVLSARGTTYDRLDYLAQSNVVSYLPSAAVGLELRARPDAAGAIALAAFGDPTPQGPMRADTLRAARSAEPLPALPGAREETERVARLLRPSEVWLGAQASEARLRGLAGDPPRHLHLATHALVDERRPELSMILLAGGGGEDGRLEAWEIAALALPVDQVVLAACGSALGRPVPGEGLVGLVQSFFDAGARSVVASLWPVADRGTVELMTDYYGALATERPAAALARTRRERIARGGLAAHPYSWASFVIVGWDGGSPRTRRP